MKLCLKCGVVIEGDWAKSADYHVGCFPDFDKMPGFDMSGFDLGLKEDLIEIVQWAHNNAGRSLQVGLGCSEVGQECELRLAYRMANVPAVHNGGDPWPATVGTAIHGWMERAVNDFQGVHGISRWLTELAVYPSTIVAGHTDLYDTETSTVIDWKFPSADNMKKYKTSGPPQQYITQVQLYGLGHERAGRPVKRVGLACLGRQGWLKDLWVWTIPYDREVALAAVKRIFTLGDKMIALGLPDSGAWDQLDRTPTRLCSWCPMWNRDASGPGANGCPGK
jgi:hypothetical protein